jgi:hypothetical protein
LSRWRAGKSITAYGTQSGLRSSVEAMAKPTILVRANQTGGFRWRVVLDGQTVGTGDAASEFEAREAANEIVKRIEAKPPEAP